jgi:hypothetical protein
MAKEKQMKFELEDVGYQPNHAIPINARRVIGRRVEDAIFVWWDGIFDDEGVFCAARPDFENIQESICAFGCSTDEAIHRLLDIGIESTFFGRSKTAEDGPDDEKTQSVDSDEGSKANATEANTGPPVDEVSFHTVCDADHKKCGIKCKEHHKRDAEYRVAQGR